MLVLLLGCISKKLARSDNLQTPGLQIPIPMSHHQLHEIIFHCKLASGLLWGIKTLKGSDKMHFRKKKIELSMRSLMKGRALTLKLRVIQFLL